MEEIKDNEQKEEKRMAILKRYLREFYLPFFELPHHTSLFFKNFFPLTKYYWAQTKIWLLTPVPRWRTIVATISFIAIMTVTLVYGGGQIFAATYVFNQTDWSGGVDASNITHPTNQTGWTKYSAQTGTNTTGTPGSVKISSLVGQFTEGFTSTTYKDASATTALWDTTANLLSNPTIISGTIYGTNETTAITTQPTLRMKNGSNNSQTTTAAADGTFSFSIPYNQLPASGTIITIWIDGATEDGTLVFRYGSSCTGNTDCTGLAIFQNAVIFSSYDGSALTHTNLADCDNDTTTSGTGCTDTEIGFTSNAGTLALSAGRTFRLKDSSASFTQGGTITAPTFKQSAGAFTGATQAITISGTFTLSGGSFQSTTNTLTVTSSWTSNSGSPSFNATTGAVNFNIPSGPGGGSTSATITPGTILFNNVTFTNNSYWNSVDYHVISGTMSVEGSLTLTQGTCCSDSDGNLIGGTVQVKGGVTIGANFASGVITGGTTVIELIGTTDQTITGSSTGYAPSITINKASGAVILSGTINVSGNWNWVSGPTLTAGSSTLLFYAKYGGPAATITPGSVSYNNVTFAITGHYQQLNNKTISGTLDVDGNLTISEVAYNTTRINGGTITVAGNYLITAANGTTFSGGTTAVTLDGTGAQTITVTLTGNGTVSNLTGTLTINKASGTATLGSNFTPGGAMTITDGTFSLGASKNLTATTLTINGAGAIFDPGSGTSALTATTFSQSNGTFNGGANTITITNFTQSGGTFNSTSGNLTPPAYSTSSYAFNGGSFVAGTGTLYMNKTTATLSGTTTLNNFTLENGDCCSNYNTTISAGATINVSGTLTWNAFYAHTETITGTGTVAVQGNIALSNVQGSSGTTTLLINGPGDQTISGSGRVPNININKASGTLTISGTVIVAGTPSWTYVAGTIAGSGTVQFDNHSGTITGSHTLPNVTFSNANCCGSTTTIIAAGTTLTVSGTTTWGTAAGSTQGLSTGTLAAQGNIVLGTSFPAGGTSTLLINGTGDQTMSSSGAVPIVNINKASGTLTISGTVSSYNNWTYTAGTIAGTGTVNFISNTGTLTGSHTLPNVTFNNLSCCSSNTMTIASGTTLTVSGNVTWGTIVGSTFTLSGGTLAVGGDYTLNSVASGSTTTAIILNGTGSQTITQTAGTMGTGTFTVDKALGTATLASNLTLRGAFTVNQGTFDQGASYNLTTGGATTVGASGVWTNTGTGDITLAGNVTNAGTVTLNSNGGTCGDAKDIVITTSSIPTTRSWGVGGTYTFWDLDVRYMTGTHTAYRTTIGTSTTWTNDDVGACTTTAMGNSNLAQTPKGLDFNDYAHIAYDFTNQEIRILGSKIVEYTHLTKRYSNSLYLSISNKVSDYSQFANTKSDSIYLSISDKLSDYSQFANTKSDSIYLSISDKLSDYSQFANNKSDNLYASLNQNVNKTLAKVPVYYLLMKEKLNTLDDTLAELWITEKAIAATNVTGQSLNVSSGALYVYTTTLTATANAGTGSITYYLSNDGGTDFYTVTSGVAYNFPDNGNGDVRWKIVLTGNATVSNIVLDYNYYGNVTLTSNAYDSTDATNIVTKVAWVSSGVDSTNLVRMQIRTSANGTDWTGWCGYADTSSCPGTNYFNASDMVSGSIDIPSNHVVRNGGDDRWFEYRVTLVPGTGGTTTATMEDVNITYVVNAPPEFNPTNGLVVSQVTDSADANYGKVKIDYSIRDPDTSTGTTNPGFITPSFQYNIGAGLVSITSGNLSANATANKAVNGTSYTAYTAYWDAQTQIPTNYLATAVVKVTINDNEGANNTASSTSANFTLDTKVPAVSASTFDSTTDTITLTVTDDTNLQYRISNNADLSADGVNATSGQWQSAGGNSISLTPAWTPTGSPSYENIYVQVRDTAGNLSSPNIVTPSTVGSANIQDISNVPISVYKEFLSWALYTPPASGAAFANYKVYRSTDGTSYSLLTTITDINDNSYFDSSVSANLTYYYKVRVTDTDGDVGNYSTAVSDKVDGQGGTDITAPTISSVTVSESQATYVTITWTTDELSNSEVNYSVSPSTAFGTTATAASFVTAHSVTVTNLTPGTTYLFRVRSTDILGNVGSNDNSGAGYSFVAGGGPVISNVTETSVTESKATITWNTNTDSDSYVSYSTNSNLSSPTRVGSAALVGGSAPFQHTVNITGLGSATRYYYFVESTDASSNYSKDTNSNNYYSFITTSDNKGPVISGVSAPVLGRTAAIVVWQTDEPATSQVQYGKSSGSYSVNTTLDYNLNIFHIGALSGLSDGDTYYYVVRSSDEGGNETISGEFSFVTGTSTVVVTGGSGASNSTIDTSPPVISGIRVKDIKPFSATVSFDTDEETIGFVDYGIDPKDLLSTSANSSHFRSSEVELRGLLPGKTYTFLVKAVDRSGNMTVSEKDTLTTILFSPSDLELKDAESFQKEIEEAIESALPSLVPPFVSKPVVSDITDTSAKVTWKTNVKSYGSLAYTEDASYNSTAEDPYGNESADTINKVTEHEINLLNLKPDTLYHIMARSFSLPEVVGRSSDLTFLTEAPKIQANIGSITNDSFKATWATSEPTTSVVEYRNLKTGELNQKSSDTKTRAHDILVDGLTPGTSYNVNVFGYNDKGNKVSIASSVRITTSIDTIPPVITSLTIDSALIAGRTDRTQTIVSWKTNEPSTSTVFYKEGSALPEEKLTNKVEQTNNLVIDHAVVVSTLKPGGLYSIQVASTDQAGNTALFPIRTAVVPQQGQSVVEIIFKNFEETFEFLR